jgi:beta-glucanase (GH16 family)
VPHRAALTEALYDFVRWRRNMTSFRSHFARFVRVFTLSLAMLGVCRTAAGDAFPQDEKSAWTLVWSDEFNGPDGSRPDPAKWKFEVGGNGWGNHELEYYTNRPENSFMRDGNLVIQALKENFTGPDHVTRDYTSARITTQGLFEQAYGRFEARIKIPRGLWPAFWLLGNDIGTIGWPGSGEIDIMENIGKEPSMVHGSLHGPGYSGDRDYTSEYKLPGGVHFADDFHVFAVEWEPKTVRFFVDQELYATFTPARLPAGMKWVFDHPFFIILNVAVGGDWPGPPDATTTFPQTMLVDYVRVYKASSKPN